MTEIDWEAVERDEVPAHDCPWDPNRVPQPLGAPFCPTCDLYSELIEH